MKYPILFITLLCVAGCAADSSAPSGSQDTTENAQDFVGSDVAVSDSSEAEAGSRGACLGSEYRCLFGAREQCVGGDWVEAPCEEATYCNFGDCAESAVTMPLDAAAHEDRIEWWYYTGHLSEGDHEWGFEISLFQQRLTDMGLPESFGEFGFMCHVAVTDKKTGIHAFAVGFELEPKRISKDPVVLDASYCRLELGGDGHDHVVAVIPEGMEERGLAGSWEINLEIDPVKPMAHHGGTGLISMTDNGGASYYYSYTRSTASGSLSTPEGQFTVGGQAWMDHQWGDFDVNAFKGWDWWSIQTDDDWEVMLFQFRDHSDEIVHQDGTIVDPEGNVTNILGLDAFSIVSQRSWTSLISEGVYPLDWDISIPAEGWEIEVRTHIDEQELPNMVKTYWEGVTTITGTRNGEDLTGVGYTELTGYGKTSSSY